MSTRANAFQLNRAATDALAAVSTHVTGIDPKLRALVELRVSQINGCVYCVNMHSGQSRTQGETQQRLDVLCVWEEATVFTEPERAALRWAESLTHISQTHAPDDAYSGLSAHFSDAQIVDLNLIISMMNAWNRISIAQRLQPGKH